MTASSRPPRSVGPVPLEQLRGQGRVIGEVRRRVDAWRGFELGPAAAPYPRTAARYEPVVETERRLTETSLTLLLHWFRHEPHVVGAPPRASAFKYWPHQRRLVETFVYLYEVCGIRRTEQLYALAGVDPLGAQHDPWPKLGGQLATGSGKTKMMALLIAWAYLNAVREPEAGLGFGRHSILIAPGLFVRDRLLQDFAPVGTPSVFFSDPVIPPELEPFWKLRVYSPETCPRTLEESDGALVVTNFHQLLGTSEPPEDVSHLTAEERQLGLLFESGDPARLGSADAPLIERFANSRGILVLNDEAHHVWDETGHARYEQKAKDKAQLAGDDDTQTAMAWIRSIRRLNADDGRVALQADLSATLFEEKGARQRGGATEFRSADLFRHAAVHYGLAEAIKDGIVKKPTLERVVAQNKKTGEALPLVVETAPNAWEKYKHLLAAGIERWKKVRDQLADEGDSRKPILFILCKDRDEAREVANYLAYGEAVSDDLSGRIPTGYSADDEKGEPLFVARDEEGELRSTVIEIHIGKKEQEADWEKVRQSVNAIDHDEIPDPKGRRNADGRPRMVPNPYNVVVSVMMLKEGWDVRNVKVIVPLRACDSRTLTEQTLGRGLRKMHPPVLDDDGAAELRPEDLFVMEHPSFSSVLAKIEDIIQQRDTDDIDHSREYVPILQNENESAREAALVRLPRFDGLVHSPEDWTRSFDSSKVTALAPKIAWLEEIAETLITTYLKQALTRTEEEGQSFSFSAHPTFRDFEHVLEEAFVIPLLRDLRTSFQHKTAVRGFVREFLETKTFALPMGIPISFARIIESGDSAKIALGNLAHPDVTSRVREALLPRLREAINAQRSGSQAVITPRKTSDLASYQAVKKHVLPKAKRSTFTTAAFDSDDELKVAVLLDHAPDVMGWVYNHRSGVGYSIEYDWHGYQSRYFPDFIVRVKLGQVVHNVILEVKGRLDDRDRTKAKRGREYCELLSQYDEEPWHYLFLLENASEGRRDITWWAERSSAEHSLAVGELLKHHEGVPLLPVAASRPPSALPIEVIADVEESAKFRRALPVLDLDVAAGPFAQSLTPERRGWALVQPSHVLDQRMFLAQVRGRSMEEGIADGSWCIFRFFPPGSPPLAAALDGKRVLVELREGADPELGGQYTLKRWRVAARDEAGHVLRIELAPDNPSYRVTSFEPGDGELRAVAELLEVVC